MRAQKVPTNNRRTYQRATSKTSASSKNPKSHERPAAQRGSTREEREKNYAPKQEMVDYSRPTETRADLDFRLDRGVLFNVAHAVVCHIINICADVQEDHWQAARYLCEWMERKILGEFVEHDLTYAPAVIFDIVDALQPKRTRMANYHVSGVVNDYPSSGSSSVIVHPLGHITALSNSYTIAHNTYDPLTGFKAIREMFAHVGDQILMKKRDEYKTFYSDDPSAYSTRASSPYNLVEMEGKFYTDQARNVACTVVNFEPPQTLWLARLGLVYSNVRCEHITYVRSAPATIVVDRMIRKMTWDVAPYQQPAIKPVNMSQLYDVIGKVVGWLNDKYSVALFQQSGYHMAKSDISFYFQFVFIRWCMPWVAVASGMKLDGIDNLGSHVTGDVINFGTGCGYVKGMDTLRTFKFIEEQLSCMRPYRASGDMWVYPIPFTTYDGDWAGQAEDGGVFIHAYNWATHLLNGTTDIPTTHNPNVFGAILKRMNFTMGTVQQFVEISGHLKEGSINSAAMTMWVNQLGTVSRTSYLFPVSDDIAAKLDTMIVPACVFHSNFDVESISYRYRERYSLDSDITYTSYLEEFAYSNFPMVHPVAGKGDEIINEDVENALSLEKHETPEQKALREDGTAHHRIMRNINRVKEGAEVIGQVVGILRTAGVV